MKNRIWISILLIVAILSSVFALAEESIVVSEVVEPVMEEAADFELPSDIVADEGETAKAEAKAVQEDSTETTIVSKDRSYDGPEDFDITFYKKKYSFSETLYIGETISIHKETGSGSLVTVKSYKSSKTSVATIVDEGEKLRVYPHAEGKATITAKATNGYEIKIKLTVKDPYAPEKVSFSSKNMTVGMGSTLKLSPVLSPSSARTTYTWKSSKTKYATVSSNGVVTPIKEGTTKITVTTANKKTASISIKVVDPYKPDSVSLPSTITIGVGQSYTLYPTLSPSTARTTFTWSTSSKKYATVSNGVVYGVKKGSTSITVKTAKGKKQNARLKWLKVQHRRGKICLHI